MEAVCDLSIGGVGFGCVGNIAILALIVLIFVAAADNSIRARLDTTFDRSELRDALSLV